MIPRFFSWAGDHFLGLGFALCYWMFRDRREDE